ncbi:MAG: hypothetical protein V7754_03070 [Halioglobus sp.]
MKRVNIQSSADLLSVAMRSVREAAQRYTNFGCEMRAYENEASATVFDQVAAIEIEREQLLGKWAKVEGLELSADAEALDWEGPSVGTQYDDAARNPIRSTPYRVLAYVAHDAERAFRFYSYIAGSSADDTACEYAEILANEELDHAALMRSMRRRAWHAERSTHSEAPDINPGGVYSLGDLLATAASLESCVLANLAALQQDHPQLQQLIADSKAALTKIEERAGSTATSGAATRNIELIETYAREIAQLDGDRERLLRRLYTDSDRSFMFYDAVVMRSTDEAVMLQAQDLTRSALGRLDLLRELMR